MRLYRLLLMLVASMVSLLALSGVAWGAGFDWANAPANPVYAPSTRAYYPDVLFSATGFDGHGPSHAYKMYYDDGSNIRLAYSEDCVNWARFGSSPVITGLRHPHVAYDPDHFGDAAGGLIQAAFPETYTVTPYYKLWLWDQANDIRFAYSADGETWYTNYLEAIVPHSAPGWQNPGSPVYDLEVHYEATATPRYMGWADNNGQMYNVSSSDGTTWTLSTEATMALALGGEPGAVTHYTAYKGGAFVRSSAPMTSGVATQERSVSSVTVRIDGATQYTDSGFVVYQGPLSGIGDFALTGEGDTFSLNLWFDRDHDGEFFSWPSGSVMAGLGADAYILGQGSVGGVLNINGASPFTSLNPGGGNYTLAQLKAGAAPGIDAATPVAIWVGINTSSGDRSSTVSIPPDFQAWDRASLSRMSVVKVSDTEWHAWYGGASPWPGFNPSGGGGNMGIGHATSADGLHWTKDLNNPIQLLGGSGPSGGLGDTGGWNGLRNYAMCVLHDPGRFSGFGDAALFKMVRSGVSTSNAYTLGFAESDVITSYRPVEGTTRFETAAKASQTAFPGGSDRVIIATAHDWPDALGGTALAGAYGCPILLVEPGSVPKATHDEIVRLGATKAFVLGGSGAVSGSVVNALDAIGISATRLGGLTRYETAAIVASETVSKLGGSYTGAAFAARGDLYPDALAASPLAYAKGWPIYLVNPASAAPTSTMAAQGVKSVHVLGNSGAVSDAHFAELVTAFGAGDVDRLGGLTRYDTAVAVATYGVNSQGMRWDWLAIATGENFPDALSGGPVPAQKGSVLLLTRNAQLAPATSSALSANRVDIANVYYLGGEGAISQDTRDEVAGVLR